MSAALRLRSSSWLRRHGAPLVAAIALLTGCGDNPAIQGACDTDADCQSGLTCHDSRVCVTSPDKALPVVLRLAPPPGKGMVIEHFDATVGGPGARQGSTWQLTAPAAVRGTVVRALDTFNSSIPGTLIATAPGKVQGTVLRYEATSHSTPQLFEGSEQAHGFELLLQIGPTYQVVFWPDSDQIPPFSTELKVGGDTDGWKLELPAADELLTISGRLVSRPSGQTACADGQALPCKDCAPLEGMRVVLVDDKGKVRSGRGLTDATGAFSVPVDPGGGVVRLRFSPTGSVDGDTPRPVGVLAQPLDLGELRKKEQKKVALGDLDVGAVALTGDKTIRVVDALGAPVGGAEVSARVALTSPQRCDGSGPRFAKLELSASQPTNAKGEVALSLPKGAAHVTVSPPVGHKSARWTKGDVAIGDAPTQITCPDRAVLRGVVLDFEAQPLVGAEVRLTALDDAQRPPVFAITGEDGRYEAPLDPGRWAVVVEPPEDSGLGRYARHTVEIEAGQEPLPLDMTLPPPTVLTGRVVDDAGAPLQGVLVDVLAGELAALKGEGTTDKALLVQETHLLGTGVTRPDGRFEILVETSQLAQ